MPTPPDEVLRLDFYSKPDCPLCDDALKALDRVLGKLRRVPVEVRHWNIETDPALFETYRLMIPVIELEGDQVALYRVNERALRRRLKDAWKRRRA